MFCSVISGGKNCPKEVPIFEEYYWPSLSTHTESSAAFEMQDPFLVNCVDFFFFALNVGYMKS